MGGSSSRWKANARGVDLNRNWNVAFKTSGRKGSSGYCGPKAESESETRALVNWSNRIQKQGKIVGIVSYHSTGSIIYGKSTSRAPKAVRNATTRMYQTAKSLTGYQLVQHESYALPHGYSRTYYLYKKKIPFITVEVGRVAKQANGAALMHYGDTTVLCTATASEKPREGIDFFPLSVEFEEKMYSVGKIPGGFNKREGKASENAVLTARVIDRPMRPLFPKDYRNDCSLNNLVLSVDTECRPELVAMIGSAIATSISDIPFYGPCATTQLGMVDGEIGRAHV